MLKKLAVSSAADKRTETLWELMCFYRHHARRVDLSIALLELLIRESTSPERTAIYYLALGQITQQQENWELALAHYNNGLLLAPRNQQTAYFLSNNAGYCLNTQGRYGEGEHYCRRAIEIDPERADAYRNLGISLHGAGRVSDASWSWYEASKKNPLDRRAFMLLLKLVKQHPYLLNDFQWITDDFKTCLRSRHMSTHA